MALARIGQQAASESLLAHAVQMAEEFGFHEVTVRAAEIRRRDAAPSTNAFILRGRAVAIAGQIALLEPGRLPGEVSLNAVPA